MLKIECTEIEKSKLIVSIMASKYCPIEHQIISDDTWESVCNQQKKFGGCNGCMVNNIQWNIVEEGVEVNDNN